MVNVDVDIIHPESKERFALDREMLSALGTNVGWLYTGMFALGSFFAAFGVIGICYCISCHASGD